MQKHKTIDTNNSYRINLFKIEIFFLLFFTVSVSAQITNFKFNHIESTNEYSINTIQAISQDNLGFIWIGTPNGIIRYDGYSFINFLHDRNNPKSLSDNFITTAFKDSRGNIWIGTNSGGLNKLDTTYSFDVIKFNGTANTPFANNIRVIREDKDGFIWVGTNGAGLYKLDPETKKYIRFVNIPGNSNSLSNDMVISIEIGNDGIFYIGTDGAGLNIFDHADNTFQQILNTERTAVNDLIEDKDGFIWIGTDRGLFKYNPYQKSIISFRSDLTDINTLSDNYISSLLIDSENTLWVGTHHGLNKFNNENNFFTRILNNPTDPESLSDNIIENLFEDKSGLIWVGTKVGGLNTLAKVKRNFRLYRNNPLDKNTISSGSVRSIFIDSADRLWIGTYGMGLNVISKERNNVSHLISQYADDNTISSNSITSVCEEDPSNFWIGTWNGGLNKISVYQKNEKIIIKDVKTFNASVEDPNSISSNVIQVIYQDSRGKLWIGTENGLNLYDSKKNIFKKFYSDKNNPKTLSDDRIQSNAIIEDDDGNLWIGTWNGLNIVHVAEDSIICKIQIFEEQNGFGLSDNRVISLYKDRNNNIWAGTYGGGLNKIVFAAKGIVKIEHYTTEDGLPNNIIYGIQGDADGNLWLSTHHGLSKFNPVTKSFVNYDASDGLQNNQFFWGACYKSKDGTLYFGGIDGLNYFDPDKIYTNEYVPSVVITYFGVLGKDKPALQNTLTNNQIELEHNENLFSIEFSSLDFTAPDKNNFAYMLEGFDDDWIYSKNRRYVAYTNLDAGTYTFKVKGSNNNNVWNEKGTSLKIYISPPVWATWYAYTAYIIIALLLIGGFIHLKTKKQSIELAMKNKALEDEKLVIATLKKVDKLKSEFLAQMSHEIRTPINTILSFTSLLKAQYEEEADEDTKISFKIITGAGERIIRTIDLILNMAEIQTGTYEYLPKQMDLYKDLLEGLCLEFSYLAKGKGLTFETIHETENTQLYSDKYIVGQIFNNLIHNAVKYTLKGGIKIRILRNEKDKLVIEVTDTGIGISDEHLKNIFDPFTQEEQGYSRQFEGNGLGLALVKEYGKIISAKIEVESEKGKGSTFRIIFPAYNFN
ncbi:MAG: hypothetical protein JEY94_10005 [Melioribacteraceae bacterium]|nr:hypothetical protein [Melioribacteraceae bacterium]